MEIAIEKKYLKFISLSVLINTLIILLFSISALAAKDSILVIRIQGKDFEQALKGIQQEMYGEIMIKEMIIDRNTHVQKIKTAITHTTPKMVVLMDNISIKLFKKYQTALPPSQKPVPSLSMMASFTDLAIKGLKNATGIFYEVPVVTSIVNLRSIMPDIKIRRVGVIYRDFMIESMQTNQMFCLKEHIDLIPYSISDEKDILTELKKGLNNLKHRIDALWVLNDSKLINAELLREAWLPFTKNFEKPIIAGVEVLVQPEFHFGTFGVIPDHVELGAQAAEMIFDIMENNWQIETNKVEQPCSVYKILNRHQAKHLFKLEDEQFSLVDKTLK